MSKIHITMGATLLAIAAGLAGCGGSTLSPSSRADVANLPADAGFGRFSDIPIPRGADMDSEHTLVFGAREAWVGRLVMSVSDRQSTMYDFYARQMPGFGWRPVTSVRGDVSVLTFTRGERVATVQLKQRTLWGSEIWLTMSPQHSDMPGVTAVMPPSAGTPGTLRSDERIQATPLR